MNTECRCKKIQKDHRRTQILSTGDHCRIWRAWITVGESKPEVLDPHSEQPSFGLYQLKENINQIQRTTRNDNVTETKHQDHEEKRIIKQTMGKMSRRDTRQTRNPYVKYNLDSKFFITFDKLKHVSCSPRPMH